MLEIRVTLIFALTPNNILKDEKRLRFEKIASKRVDKVLESLRLLGNCLNTNNYNYDKKDVELMFSEIRLALKNTTALYDNELTRKEKRKFKF